MSPRTPAVVKRPWTRPGVPNPKPNRSFGGLYRTAEHEQRGETFGGVPLQAAEDAVVAAVRMGYRVADEQIERGRRIASRLRGAAERDGTDGLGDAVGGVEQLITRALQNGLQWIEETARDPQSPIKRLASAELTLLGSLFGLTSGAPNRTGGTPADRQTAEPPRQSAGGGDVDPPSASQDWQQKKAQIQLEADSDERAVRIVAWQVRIEPGFSRKVTFRSLNHDAESIPATLEHLNNGTILRMTIPKEQRPGRWRAAVLDEQRVQLGFIDIEL